MVKRRSDGPNRKNRRISYLIQSELLSPEFERQLKLCGLMIREIPGDGNCLFRALSDQMTGTCDDHHLYRSEVCDYISNNRQDFEPFFEDFEKSIDNLRNPGVFAGNESLVAFARLKKVSIVIHQEGLKPWIIECGSTALGDDPSSCILAATKCEDDDNTSNTSSDDCTNGSYDDVNQNIREMHISYHSYEHYNSVRRINDASNSPANVQLAQLYSTEKLVSKKRTKKKNKRSRRHEQKKINNAVKDITCQLTAVSI